MYPDGYLGTIRTRREDRLLDGLKQRQNNRPYTRGIHKGERLDQKDYFFPPEFNLWTGLERQMSLTEYVPEENTFYTPASHRRASVSSWSTSATRPTARSGLAACRPGATVPGFEPNPDRTGMLRAQAPPWGVRGNPGMTTPYPGR